MEKSEQKSGGIATALCIVIILGGVLFGWAPISHLLSKWNNYWDDEKVVSMVTPSFSDDTPSIQFDFSAYRKSSEDCYNRAVEKFHKTNVYSEASSTSSSYSTYDCYGLPLIKLE